MNQELFRMIRSARRCTAFTGAGISTLSGIPDFRGSYPRELLRKFSPEVLSLYLSGLEELPRLTEGKRGKRFQAGLPETVFDINRFEEDPSFFYKAAAEPIYGIDPEGSLCERKPSVVHTVLAELERQGLIKAVITQNIDMLHRKAGSVRVIEIHGSPAIHYCLRCAGIRMGFAEAVEALAGGGLPRCPQCGRALKPAITFYGESLPLEALREAFAEAQEADLMLILGTSLTVHPAAELPRAVLRRGGRIVIVNRQDTVLDESAALRFRDLEEVFAL